MVRQHAWFYLVAIGLLWAGPTQWGAAQITGESVYPAQRGAIRLSRLIHRFDFEEAKFNNFEDLPMHWFVIGRPADTANPTFLRQPMHSALTSKAGFPRFTTVRFDPPQSQPGNHRLYLGLDGGNVGAFLEVGALPAVPGSDYLVTAAVRTTDLHHAGAKLVAYFIDARGHPLTNSQVTSQPVRTKGQWQPVSVRLLGDFPEAAWIGLHVQLMQPTPQPQSPLGRHQVVFQDVQGEAWFDNISVWQLPHLAIKSQSRANIIHPPDQPQLTMKVRDLTGRGLTAHVKVYDHLLRLIDQDQQRVGDGQPESWNWQPTIERFGWYLVDMIVYEQPAAPEAPHPDVLGTPVARTLSAMLWLPEETAMRGPEAQRFVITAGQLSQREMTTIPQVLSNTGLGGIVLDAWASDTTPTNIEKRQDELDELIQAMVADDKEVVLSLYPVPDQLAQELDIPIDSPLSLFHRNRESWLGYLAPVLMRHGQRVRRWQLGWLDRPEAFFRPELPELLQSIYREFRNLAPQPRLVVPWRLDQARSPLTVSDLIYAIDVPLSVMPGGIGPHTQNQQQPESEDFWLHLRQYPATELSHARRIEDLVLRMLHGWETQAERLVISRPWTHSANRRFGLLPDPVLGVFSSVASRLQGRRVIGRLPLGDGMQCMILDGPPGGMLVAWNESAPPQEAWIDIYLGPHPVAIDVWGNRQPIPLTQGRHRIALTSTPQFIIGIDPTLALLRASFKVEPAFIESTTVPHERVLTFVNPWPRTISGRLFITEPQTWTISPKQHHFSLSTGQKATFPIQIRFPVYEVAGRKHLSARFEFLTDQSYRVNLHTPMELGLPDVELDASLSLEPNPNTNQVDAVVTQLITNKGSETRSLYAFANMPGFPRQERIITQLQPGQSVVRRFRFPNGADRLRQTDIRAGIRESIGPAVLNVILSTDDL